MHLLLKYVPPPTPPQLKRPVLINVGGKFQLIWYIITYGRQGGVEVAWEYGGKT